MCVAPKATAVSSLASETSTATIVVAPANTAPCTALSPTPPVPITTTVAPAATRGGVDDGAEAGDHAAGEQRGAVERDLGGDHDRLRGVDDDLLGERPRAQALDDRASVEGRQGAVLVERERRAAEGRLSVRARAARPAGADQRHDDVVADREPFDAGTDLGDDTGCLVPEHGRQRAAPRALEIVEVALADRAGGELHAQLAGVRCRDLDLLDHERLAERAADRGPHLTGAVAWPGAGIVAARGRRRCVEVPHHALDPSQPARCCRTWLGNTPELDLIGGHLS